MAASPKTRTHIRAISVGTQTVVFEVPEWKPNVWFQLQKTVVPLMERGALHPGFRCSVSVNLDAETADQLDISNWGLY